MIFKKLNSLKEINVNINKYRIDWEGSSASKIQTAVKLFLKRFWSSHIVLEEFRIPGSLLRCDILNVTKRIAIEVSPSQHYEFNKFFHNNSNANFLQHIKRDMAKINWLESNDFDVIELNEEDVDNLSSEYILKKFNIKLI